MKYLFVIPTLSNGGAERVVSVLSTALSECKRDVIIVKYYEEQAEYLLGEKVKVYNLSGADRESYLLLGKIELIKRLRNIIKQEKPDFVIPFMYSVAQLTAISTWGLSVNVVQSMRINPAVAPVSRIKRVLRDGLVYRSKITFVQNKEQKNYFKKKYHNKIHVLFNPVSSSFFNTEWCCETGRFIFCSMGRLVSQKNYYLAINAFCKAFPNMNDIEYHIYGEGALKNELDAYISSINMQHRIKLKGRTNNVTGALSHSNCFILSSNDEGMPNALIEAMACGIPCISTDCPTGPSDLLTSGHNGILTSVGDVDEMSVAMKHVYYMKECDRREMANNGRKTVKEVCSEKAIAQKMISICEKGVEK